MFNREDAFLFTSLFSIFQQGMYEILMSYRKMHWQINISQFSKSQTGQNATYYLELTSKTTSARTQFMEAPTIHE